MRFGASFFLRPNTGWKLCGNFFPPGRIGKHTITTRVRKLAVLTQISSLSLTLAKS